jgi:hypothetical protein
LSKYTHKEARLAVAEAYPILIHGIPFKPAAHATIDVPDETEANILSEPRPSHVRANLVMVRWTDESMISLLKKLLTDSMLFEPYPLGTVMSTLKVTFQATGKPPYSRPYRTSPTDRIIICQLIDESNRQRRIQVSSSPNASPVHIVERKDGPR